MAKCEEGYLCDICGGDVEQITDSGLYLAYVIGELDPERLHVSRERHLCCHPILSQFIVHPEFKPVTVDGPFNKQEMDARFVSERECLVTRGYERLREISGLELAIIDYPLPEIRSRWADRST